MLCLCALEERRASGGRLAEGWECGGGRMTGGQIGGMERAGKGFIAGRLRRRPVGRAASDRMVRSCFLQSISVSISARSHGVYFLEVIHFAILGCRTLPTLQSSLCLLSLAASTPQPSPRLAIEASTRDPHDASPSTPSVRDEHLRMPNLPDPYPRPDSTPTKTHRVLRTCRVYASFPSASAPPRPHARSLAHPADACRSSTLLIRPDSVARFSALTINLIHLTNLISRD